MLLEFKHKKGLGNSMNIKIGNIRKFVAVMGTKG